VPWTIPGPKRDEVTNEWRKLQNENLYDLHFSPNRIPVVISTMRYSGQVACTGKRRNRCIQGLGWET
jgi:hypothetical protein